MSTRHPAPPSAPPSVPPPAARVVTVGSTAGHQHARRPRGRWIGPVAALWWGAGAAIALVVTLSGGVLPVGDASDSGFGALTVVPASALSPWIAVLALVGAALAVWTWRGGRARPVPRAVRTATVAAVAVVAVGASALADAAILARLGYLPVTLIMAPFDPVMRAAFVDFVNPAVVLQLASLGGAGLLAASAVRFARRGVGACESCGRRLAGADPTWTTPVAAARWGRAAALVAAAIPAFYAVTRIAWALGIPLGFSPENVEELAGSDGLVAALGLGTFAVVGAVLTLGLFQRWGEVFPRWIVGLAGRRVPVKLAVVPATVVAIAVLPAGLSMILVGLSGDSPIELTADQWGAVGPTLLWPLWSLTLAAATYAYWLRRREPCTTRPDA